MPNIIIYPGSFDPPTMGHLSLIERALPLFDKIIIAVAKNLNKEAMFTVEERIKMLQEAVKEFPQDKIEIDTFTGLLVEYAQSKNAKGILRGLRAISDFEYEFQIAMVNRQLNSNIESIFLMTDYKYFYISSSIVKELASYGADMRKMVPENVYKKLKEKFNEQFEKKFQDK